jgi:hypothetical protein
MAFRIFLDADVLIAGFKGEPREVKECAQAILSEPLFEFWYSPLLKMELTIMPTYQGHHLELAFYNAYFKSACMYGELNRMFEVGAHEAVRHGITVIDALHIAAAHLARCPVLVTGERATRPMFRTTLVKVVCLRDVLKSPVHAVQKLLTS